VISTLNPPPTSTVVKSLKSMSLVITFREPTIVRDGRNLPMMRTAHRTAATMIAAITIMVMMLVARWFECNSFSFLWSILCFLLVCLFTLCGLLVYESLL